MSPSNNAAWLTHDKETPLQISSSPYPDPADDEIVIKCGAFAINQVDWAVQLMGKDLFSFLEYPLILGTDVAGEVVGVGKSVSRFKEGDRVVGHALSWGPKGAFQEYTVLQEHMTSSIPDSLSFVDASVIPLGLSTAACGLYEKDFLALPYPQAQTPPKKEETLLITGGASSVGSCAIQLAVASGYEVITTTSPTNFDYVMKLGASKAFDYNSETLTQDLIDALKDKKSPGIFAIARGSENMCLEIAQKYQGRKFVSMAVRLPENIPQGVDAKFIFASTLRHNEVGKAIYECYLPHALANNTFIAAPRAEVVGNGLSALQNAFDIQRKGVSARKIVVSM